MIVLFQNHKFNKKQKPPQQQLMKNYKDFFVPNRLASPRDSFKNKNVKHLQRVPYHRLHHSPISTNQSKVSSDEQFFGKYGQNSDDKNFDCQSCSSNSTGQFGVHKVADLCCRTYFTENQVISQPQSDVCEFKAYTFPFNKTKIDTILKTMCGFLNWNGGHIYIGIEENVTTKQHKVIGETYNEAQKQDLLKLLRVNAGLIEPDILINNKMKICFVPVKSCLYPYAFVAGRFVVKIQISPGSRDELYTLKTEQGQYFLCMRTENQVLTCDIKKDLRKILQIQKERARTPLSMPRKLHKYECKKPEEGIRLFEQQSKNKAKIKKNKRRIKRISVRRKQEEEKKLTEKGERKKGWEDKKSSRIEVKVQVKRQTDPLNIQKAKVVESKSLSKRAPPQILTPCKIQYIEEPIQFGKSLNLSREFTRFQQKYDGEKAVSLSKSVKREQSNFSNNCQKQKFYGEGKSSMDKSLKTLSLKEQSIKHENEVTKYFYRYGKCNPTLTSQDLTKFVEELKTAHTSNHGFAALEGYSKKSIERILSQFKSDSRLPIFDLERILVFKFSKHKLGQKNLQEVLEKAISHQISYTNTSMKRKNKSLIFPHSSRSTIAKSFIQEPKVSKQIFKLTSNLKVNKYSMLSKALKQKINERISYVQKITKQKCVVLSSLKKFDDSNLVEVVQFSFKNLCYSLLAFLELKELQVQLIFC